MFSFLLAYLRVTILLVTFDGGFFSFVSLFLYFGISLGFLWFFFRPTYLSCIVMGVFVLGFDVINAWDDIKSFLFLFLSVLFLSACLVCLSSGAF